MDWGLIVGRKNGQIIDPESWRGVSTLLVCMTCV